MTEAKTESASRAEVLQPGTSNPVRLWALAGGAFLALQLGIYTAWISSGNAHATATGPTPVPGWMTVVARLIEVASIVGGAVFLTYFLVKPWRREGRITLDGLLVIAFLSMYWQDPMLNLFVNWFTYNATLWNFGSWASNIPGWFSPNGHLLPQGIAVFFPAYAYALLGGTVLGCAVMRRAKVRWPNLGKLGLVIVGYCFFVAFDLIVENIALRLGLWAYPGAIRSLSISPGHYYQFPIYEALLLPGAFTGWAYLRFFRDDHGRTWPERGIEGLPARRRSRNAIRALALVGACNVILLGYNAVIAVTALYSDPWPQDILERSYLTNGFCGPSTDYACPGPDVPVPRRGSVHVTPHGTVSD